MSEPARAVTRDLDPGRFRFSVWRNVSITMWTDQLTLDAGERVLRISRQLNEEFPEGRSQVMIVVDGAPPPDGPASELLTEIYNPKLSRIVCIAAVLEGEGFWASAIRSRMTSMRIAGGGAMAIRTHQSVEEVPSWLPEEHAKRTGVTLSALDLRAVLQAVRAQGTRGK
ncbi:MAG TPA: hypothetical protein VJV78_10725 [Polyangiales bacterium]|nr:hypothetical protein [Polyangiales bacterium]